MASQAAPPKAVPTKPSKVGLAKSLIGVELAFTKHLVSAPFRGPKGAATYKRDVLYGSLRQIISGYDISQMQYLLPNTERIYRLTCRSKSQKPVSIELGAGGKGHWIGRQDAKFVMLYIHGGGFYAPATFAHLQYQFNLLKTLNSTSPNTGSTHSKNKNSEFGIFSLHYTLAPQAQHPTQLHQAALALEYLLTTRDAGSIIIAGDSAGGNLASALLLHLARPHPDVPPVNLHGAGKAKIHAALLISPWICFSTSKASMHENARSDYVPPVALTRASEAYIPAGAQHDMYSQPVFAPVEAWTEVATSVVNEVMVWGGGHEVLKDSIETFGNNVRNGFRAAEGGVAERCRVEITPKHAHEEMIIDSGFLGGIVDKGTGALVVEDWLKGVLVRREGIVRGF